VSNPIAIRETKSLEALDANIGSDTEDARPLRYKDGRWLEGYDKTFLERGTVMRFAPESIQDGFKRWSDGKPTDSIMREWISTQPAVKREDLGDTDESQWENGKDPWSYTLIAALKDAEGVLYKFSTGSTGGVNAIRKLMRTWRRDRDRHPGLVPVVALTSDSYEHKIHRTTVSIPVFEIVSWEPWQEDEASPPQDERSQVAHALEGDEITFAPEWR
jgi:hypothetical protein